MQQFHPAAERDLRKPPTSSCLVRASRTWSWSWSWSWSSSWSSPWTSTSTSTSTSKPAVLRPSPSGGPRPRPRPRPSFPHLPRESLRLGFPRATIAGALSRLGSSFALTLCLFLATTAAAHPQDGIATLEGEAYSIFHNIPEDPHPEILEGPKGTEGSHYATGNEDHLYLFYKKLRKRGGAYVGVGTDQAYLFIGWQRPELAWLIDYDQLVVDLHEIYRVVFAASERPRDFLWHWRLAGHKQTLKLLDEALASEPPVRREHLKNLYRRYRQRVFLRLVKVRNRMYEEKTPSFLTRKRQFRFVKDLVAAKRVRAVRVDLLANGGLIAIGQAAKRLGVPIRVLYLSNAEQYWKYTDQFRENIAHVFHDERSLLVRTLLTWKRNREFRYVIQPLSRYAEWVSRPWVKSVNRVVPARTDDDPEVDYVYLRWSVERVEKRRAKRRAREKKQVRRKSPQKPPGPG